MHPLVLEGRLVRLEPLQAEHIGALLAITRASPEIFRYSSTPVTDAQAEAYFGRAWAEREQGVAYPFVMKKLPAGEIVGSSRFSDIRWEHRNCEVGYTWIAPRLHGTGLNPESKYLMLRYAFETLNFLRVHFYVDSRNGRSQQALRRLGAVYEGTLRCERILKDGFVRDSMIFSIIHSEWPQVKAGLQARLKRSYAGL